MLQLLWMVFQKCRFVTWHSGDTQRFFTSCMKRALNICFYFTYHLWHTSVCVLKVMYICSLITICTNKVFCLVNQYKKKHFSWMQFSTEIDIPITHFNILIKPWSNATQWWTEQQTSPGLFAEHEATELHPWALMHRAIWPQPPTHNKQGEGS